MVKNGWFMGTRFWISHGIPSIKGRHCNTVGYCSIVKIDLCDYVRETMREWRGSATCVLHIVSIHFVGWYNNNKTVLASFYFVSRPTVQQQHGTNMKPKDIGSTEKDQLKFLRRRFVIWSPKVISKWRASGWIQGEAHRAIKCVRK